MARINNCPITTSCTATFCRCRQRHLLSLLPAQPSTCYDQRRPELPGGRPGLPAEGLWHFLLMYENIGYFVDGAWKKILLPKFLGIFSPILCPQNDLVRFCSRVHGYTNTCSGGLNKFFLEVSSPNVQPSGAARSSPETPGFARRGFTAGAGESLQVLERNGKSYIRAFNGQLHY